MTKLVAFLLFVFAAGLACYLGAGTELASVVRQPDGMQKFVQGLGAWGPVAIVLLRGVGCLLAVVPTSPLVVAAGLIYGGFWGAVFALAGGVSGAVVAFLIGRRLGYDFVERKGLTASLTKTRPGRWLLGRNNSQNRLMAAVFMLRGTPVINLDGVSYVAGVTPISLWRFCLATLAGLLPYNILLVTMGDQLRTAGAASALIVLAAVLILVGLPLAWVRAVPCPRQRGQGCPISRAASAALPPFDRP